jgi:transposase-like protein/ribosomal protein L37AE/L43A
MLPADLPADMPAFLARFGSDEACREHLFHTRYPAGFCCKACSTTRCYVHITRNIYECSSCGKQHSLLAGTIFEQTKKGLSKWFLAIFLVTTSKSGMSAAELGRLMGFKSDQTAWSWLSKIRRVMVVPGREPLSGPVEVDEAFIGGPKPGKRGRGAAGKTIVACAVETRILVAPPPVTNALLRGIAKRKADRVAQRAEAIVRRCLGRVRFGIVPDAGAKTLEAFMASDVAPPASVTTDGHKGYVGLAGKGYQHQPINISKSPGEAHEYLPAVHLVFALVKRWLLGTHHGGVSPKHLRHYLDEYAFRFNRRTAKALCQGLQKVLEIAVVSAPCPYWRIVGRNGPS